MLICICYIYIYIYTRSTARAYARAPFMRSVHALAQPLSIWYPIAYTGSNQSKHRFKLVPWPSPWLGPWGYLLYTFEIENNQTRCFVFQKSVRHHPKTITKRCQRGPKFNAKPFQKLPNIVQESFLGTSRLPNFLQKNHSRIHPKSKKT